MTEQVWYLIVAALAALLIPLAPRLVQVRIAVLRKLHLNWFARWHERYSKGIVLWVRLVLAAMVVVLLVQAFGG